MKYLRGTAAAFAAALLLGAAMTASAKEADVRFETLSTYSSEFRGFEAKIAERLAWWEDLRAKKRG